MIPDSMPHGDLIREKAPEYMADGGSCVAGPDGEWLIEPVQHKEFLQTVEIDYQKVLQARQSFDPTGHYSRPDVFQLQVNRERQQITKFNP